MIATVTRGLSPQMARLLLEGDTECRYMGRNDSEEGYRLTMALAVAASQPGRAWSPADFHRALIYTPTEAGSWARRLRANKGPEYAEGKLTAMLLKARQHVAERPPITCRPSGWEAVARARAVVDRMVWRCKGGGDTDLKNLAARLELCEKTGGFDHELSIRRQAELMGCAKQTAANSNKRLKKHGLLIRDASGAGTDHGSRWRLTVDELSLRRWAKEREDDGAGPGHRPAAGTGGGRTSVPGVHTDTRKLAGLVSHDAFHRYGHGTTGARILASLDVTEGKSARELREALAVHRTTISRRLALLVEDGLVVELEGLYYLAKPLAGPAGELEADAALLDASAERRGTAGAGERRRQRHARDRVTYQRWRAEKKQRREREREPLRLVPEGVVNEETGEIIDPEWRGWDVSDPFRPVPLPQWAATA
ncbi:helix-turn-helix domain-containing protein [Streptomyces rimosus]|uniref:helix-turn-helix domain-containing protein n=1 Tax=Streptomyces rimosus TaxID=1927 RepID=UPI00067E14AD|nr:helix-turn-helix domain-containing protein [Streptomyces rimosus]